MAQQLSVNRRIERNGHARVPASYTVDGYRLGAWVAVHRHFRSKGVLEAARERRLQELPGWTWNRRADWWEEGFSRLLEYVERAGDARVPVSHMADGFRLGGWVTTQRHFHAKGILDPDREHRLQNLPGWTWKARLATEASEVVGRSSCGG